ncbi:hypothetical protein HMPREF0262_03101 [Clostridium sp. ATCC 29733]|nr:hypothetical protein HMPREF0262_03101 [Clostridium sp. ATCC 29733]
MGHRSSLLRFRPSVGIVAHPPPRLGYRLVTIPLPAARALIRFVF